MSNQRKIIKATLDDMEDIMRLVEDSRQIMRANGNPHQWGDGHPSRAQFEHDINRGNCYLIQEEGETVGVFCFIPDPDASYSSIEGRWIDDQHPYSVVHRIAGKAQCHGLFADTMRFCLAHSPNLRIDTHRDNVIMQHLLEKWGFVYCGIIHLQESGDERLAYQHIGNQ